MTDLKDLLDRTADRTRGPASSWTAGQAYARGLRRRRLRTGAVPAGTSAVLVAAAIVGTTVLTNNANTTVPGGPGSTVVAAFNAGSDELYVVAEPCVKSSQAPSPFPDPCPAVLYASVDGGNTWTARTGPLPNFVEVKVVGPDAFSVTRFLQLENGSADFRSEVSLDGGRTWQPWRVDSTPMAALPDGAVPYCVAAEAESCVVGGFDPVTGADRPLAAQPPVLGTIIASESGKLWVAGVRRGGTQIAVATSRDRGRTWTVTNLSATGDGYDVTVTVADPDNNAYVTWDAAPYRRVFGTTDGGTTWTDADPGRTLDVAHDPLVVAADGTHIVRHNGISPAEHTWLANRDGTGYRPVTLEGLSPEAAVKVVTGSGPRAIARTHDEVYTTDDGWTWRRIW